MLPVALDPDDTADLAGSDFEIEYALERYKGLELLATPPAAETKT